jgi:hypothetical protein
VVSPSLLEQARESIAGSYRIAEGLDAGVREPFLHLVNTAFVHGFHLSIMVSVVAALVGAVVAFIALPSTLPSYEPEVGAGAEPQPGAGAEPQPGAAAEPQAGAAAAAAAAVMPAEL